MRPLQDRFRAAASPMPAQSFDNLVLRAFDHVARS
jgi:hypothetical protein